MIRSSTRLLLVDDEPNILIVFKGQLSENGYEVQTASNARDGFALLATQRFDLLIVDLKMPGPSGLNLIERVHQLQPKCAIVMISANAAREQIIDAFRKGADDFLLKPITRDELQQAVGRALLKRAETNQHIADPTAPATSDLVIDAGKHEVLWYGRPLALTPTEFCLLLTLARNAGKSVPPALLIEHCRGYPTKESEARILLKPHIASLRKKLAADGHTARVLINHRGMGFMLNTTAHIHG